VAVSPADFELYSRATGAPYPRTAEERMRMAPEAYNYSRNFAREPNIVQKAAGTLGKAAQLGGALAGVYGISKALGPETTAAAISALTERAAQPDSPSEPSPPSNEGYQPPSGGERERKRVTTGYDYGDRPTQRSGPPGKAPFQPKEFLDKAVNTLTGGALAKGSSDPDYSAWDDDEGYVDEGNTRRYDRFEGAGLAKQDSGGSSGVDTWKEQDKNRGAIRRWGEDKLANRPLEKDILRAGEGATTAVIGKNALDAANIIRGEAPMGNAVTDAVTEGMGGVKEAIMQRIAPYHAATEFGEGIARTGHEAYEGLRNAGFMGRNMGQLLDWAGTQASHLPGANEAMGLGHNVLEAASQVATNMPVEMFFGVGGAVAGATAMGVARGLNKGGKALGPTSDTVKRVGGPIFEGLKQTAETAVKVINAVKGDNPQLPGGQKSIAPSRGIHEGEEIQGGVKGLAALPSKFVERGRDDSRKVNRRFQDVLSTLAKSMADKPPEVREQLARELTEGRTEKKTEKSRGLNFIQKATEALTSDNDEEIVFPFTREEQQGPATHLIRRSAEREANPRYRYKGAKGISSDPSTGRTDIYFRASPEATGGTGVQKRSFYSEDPATGRYLEHDALDTTQPGYQGKGYMMDEEALKAKSFMSKFTMATKRGMLLDAVDEAGDTMQANDPYWDR